MLFLILIGATLFIATSNINEVIDTFRLSLNSSGITPQRSDKIILTPSMIIKETAIGDAGMLVDEQKEAGDPASGSGGKVSKKWSTGWNKDYFPSHAVIDLGKEYQINSIYFFDTHDYGSVAVSTGIPFKWKEEFIDKLESYFKWNEHKLNVKTRYIRISVSNHVTPVEVVIYGTPTETSVQHIAKSKSRIQPPIDEFIGINAFIDDPLDKIKVAGVVREYHNWNWDEGNEEFGKSSTYPGFPNNQNAWNPSLAGNWNFDDFYEKLKKEKIIVSPVIQGSVSWIVKKYGEKPILQDENPELPSSYAEHADHLFQFAARYGSQKQQEEKLKLANNQSRISGLNTIRYIENWNEQDAWWSSRLAFFSPYEYAAMASADYDGHLRVMGKTFGVKNADPNIKLVMGGTARLNLDYIKAIKFWADYNRSGSFPADVINVHHYSNDGEDQANGKVGISPEDEKLKEKLRKIVDYRNTYLPDKEVWITEFGYDTHQGSPQRAPAIANYSPKEVQAQWLVRSYLELAAAGVDRACMFMLRDVDSTSSIKFNSSGLVSNYGVWHPKPSWYYLYTLKNQLSGMRFSREILSGNSFVLVYEFKNSSNSKSAYVIWCPTSEGKIVKDFNLKLPANCKKATLVTLKEGKIKGEESALISKDKINIEVSERPVFIIME